MFHKFSATPKIRLGSGQLQDSELDDTNKTPSKAGNTPLTKRRKVARACDRCRLNRLRCDEQKPCAPCVGVREKCVVSYAPPRASQANSDYADPVTSESVPESTTRSLPLSPPNETPSRDHGFSSDSSHLLFFPTANSQESSQVTGTPGASLSMESFTLAHVRGFFGIHHGAASDNTAHAGCHYPQLPHPSVPSGEPPAMTNTLPDSHRSYYLWLFWDACHPLLPIMSKIDFSDHEAMRSSTIATGSTGESALIDAMIALGIQHSHATGRTSRVMGLQHPSASTDIWPGFEYFYRSCKCLRNTSEVTLDLLRGQTLLIIYLMRGNAILDAYNLIGIAVRRAYVLKLHRQPPNNLSDDVKAARMQLWWTLFTLDLQCALQLDMPPAIQKNLVQCPFPTENDLARYLSSSSHSEEGTRGYICSNLFVNLIVLLTHINASLSETAVSDEKNVELDALEKHAHAVSSAVQALDSWHQQIPPDLALCPCTNGLENSAGFPFSRAVLLPEWLIRQAVLLELHYHNTYMLIQRPFIRLRPFYDENASSMMESPELRTLNIELHVSGSLHHATVIIDMLLAVSSMSDVLYGWSEALQPLWNATLTILALVATNSRSPLIPKIRESLTNANDLFKFLSPTCATARSAQGIIQSLIGSLYSQTIQNSPAANEDDPMGWHAFASLFEDQAFSSGLDSTPLVQDPQGEPFENST